MKNLYRRLDNHYANTKIKQVKYYALLLVMYDQKNIRSSSPMLLKFIIFCSTKKYNINHDNRLYTVKIIDGDVGFVVEES